MNDLMVCSPLSASSLLFCVYAQTIMEFESFKTQDPEKYAELPNLIAQGVCEGGEEEEFWRSLANCYGIPVFLAPAKPRTSFTTLGVL